jgi:L-aminopeptidase/D-esterase-like protein
MRGAGGWGSAARRVSGVDFTPLGLMVGHATDAEGGTGVTVVRHEQRRWRGGYCIVGRATGTRELNALSTTSLADRVDAIMLTGGLH